MNKERKNACNNATKIDDKTYTQKMEMVSSSHVIYVNSSRDNLKFNSHLPQRTATGNIYSKKCTDINGQSNRTYCVPCVGVGLNPVPV